MWGEERKETRAGATRLGFETFSRGFSAERAPRARAEATIAAARVTRTGVCATPRAGGGGGGRKETRAGATRLGLETFSRGFYAERAPAREQRQRSLLLVSRAQVSVARRAHVGNREKRNTRRRDATLTRGFLARLFCRGLLWRAPRARAEATIAAVRVARTGECAAPRCRWGRERETRAGTKRLGLETFSRGFSAKGFFGEPLAREQTNDRRSWRHAHR